MTDTPGQPAPLTDFRDALRARLQPIAWFGALIALIAVLLATMLSAIWLEGDLSWRTMLSQQRSNPVLWVLDLLPLIYAAWGQLSQVALRKQTTELIHQETESLRERTAALERRASRATLFDPLTDLPNRVLFRDRLEQAIQLDGNLGKQVLILLIDLVRFREINESIGHRNGDRILRSVAMRLDAIRPVRSTLARIGSDEFAWLVTLPSAAVTPEALASSIHDALVPHFETAGASVSVRACIGAALYPSHGTNADVLLRRADVATDKAKRSNTRGGLVMYAEDLDQFSPQRLTLMSELRNSIAREELELHYQPKLEALTLKPVGMEALVRWRHPAHGLVPPGEFVSMAESTGFINDITRWVLSQGLHDCAQMQTQGLGMVLAVNVAAQTLLDDDFPDLVFGLLAKHHLPANQLILEITETTVMVDEETTARILGRLSDAGVRFSIDDFGTGYSSLYYLRKLPFSEIKIDRSFVFDMLTNKNDGTIVKATVQLAHNLGMTVVAEGVETDAQVAHLLQLNADKLQGFRFTPALPVDEYIAWVDRWNREERPQMLDDTADAACAESN